MITRRSFAAFALAVTIAIPLVAHAKLAKTGDATGRFRASGPAGLSITGSTSDVAVSDDGAQVTVEVKLGALSTGIALRDKHTKNYLEVDTYPSAKLTVPRASLKFPDPGKEVSGDAKGSLTVHGQTKDVTFHYSAKKDGDTISVKGSVPININDYGIKTPSYLGVSVKPDITIETDFRAKDN
jgi:polyisoprenoid-binding protein YceI